MLPVTILTGFLGSGKTTLLNRILTENHGRKIAVIENEFGEAGIDNQLLVQNSGEQIVEMNNGCICCTVRGDLVRILGELWDRRIAGDIDFERVIIETTGLADPAPVAQTFYVDPEVAEHYYLDAIITVVDAVHADMQLNEHHECQEQVGFADRILLSKCDIANPAMVDNVETRLRRINARAPITRSDFGKANIDDILDIRAFDLDAILQIEPDFLSDVSHEHDDDISSFVFRDQRAFDLESLRGLFEILMQAYGKDMLRYKGVLHVDGHSSRILIQGVHMIMMDVVGEPWQDERRENTLVFIGRDLPKDLFLEGLKRCLVENSR